MSNIDWDRIRAGEIPNAFDCQVKTGPSRCYQEFVIVEAGVGYAKYRSDGYYSLEIVDGVPALVSESGNPAWAWRLLLQEGKCSYTRGPDLYKREFYPVWGDDETTD